MMGFLWFVLESRIKNKVIIVGAYITFGIVSYFLNNMNMILKMIVMIVVAVIICFLAFKDRFLVKIGCVIHSFYIFTISDIIFGDLISLINRSSIQSTLLSSKFGAIVASLIIKAINLVLFVISIYIFKKADKKNYYWICLDIISGCFLIISMTFAILYPVITYSPNEMSLFLFLSILFFISSFLILFLFMKLSVYIKKEHYWAINDIKSSSLIQQLEMQKSYIDETNKIRHDYKKVLNTINYLFVGKDYASLKSYLADIADTYSSTNNISYSGNQYIDSVINYKMTECSSSNIDLKLEVSPQVETPLEPNDNILVIANLLDNAIEAVNKLSDEPREIEFNIYNYGRNFVMCSKNKFVSEQNKSNFFTTSKKESALHGYGIDIIREIVTKYHGQVSFEHDNELFKAVVMIPLSA